MRVVLTLLARDEADVVEANLVHHLALGFDHVIVTDHRSSDGTTEIVERFAADRGVTLIREESEQFRQSDWVTRMARLAATEHGADWVINGDADELWWPREGSLHDVLAAVPARFGALRGLWRNFVPRPDDGRPFQARMTIRRRSASDLTDPFHAQVKVVHRAHPEVVVTDGNHDALGPSLPLIREWLPFEVLHFPIRSAEQMRRKFRVARAARLASPGISIPQHTEAAVQVMDAEGDQSFYDRFVMDDAAIEGGLASGELTSDTRVRDRLHALVDGATPPEPPSQTLEDDVAFADEAQAMLEHDGWVKLTARAERLERRLDALARSPLIR